MNNNTQQTKNPALEEQLAAAYPGPEKPMPVSPSGLDPQAALEAFSANPVAFIQGVVETAAQTHLYSLKEEAELRGALLAFRKTNPEARQFEPYILQEVAELIQNDDDGDIDPWEKLLEKGLENFKKKFKAALKQDPALLEKQAPGEPQSQMEGAANRRPATSPAAFTRDQIAKMSLSEFIEQEEAINDALKNKRIR